MDQNLVSIIEDKIKMISIFEVLNCNDDIQKEIRNVSELILTSIEKEKNNNLYMNMNDLIINYDDNIDTLEKYNQLNKKINTYLDEKTKTYKFLEYFKLMEEYIKEMRDYGFPFDINLSEQRSSVTLIHEASNQQLNNNCKIYNDLHNNAEKFSICVLFDENRNIWLNRRIDSKKDFYNYYQVAGGKLEFGKTYEECIIREVKEESGIEIDKEKLKFVCYDDYFSNYMKKIFKCAIFIYYTNEIPVNCEPEKQDDWFKIDINLMVNYKLTDSLFKYYGKIKQTILEYDIQNKISNNNTEKKTIRRKKKNSDNNTEKKNNTKKKNLETQSNNIINISDEDNNNGNLKRKRDINDNDNDNKKNKLNDDQQQYNDKILDIKQEEYYTQIAIDSI